MCGVIGFFTTNPDDIQIARLERLFEQSKIRGLHSFGITIRTLDGELKTFKSLDLSSLKNYLRNAPPFDTLIGHNRYSTSGDWHDENNNQPIVIPGISVVFNGIITQATKREYELALGKKFITENDGEIFARKVIDGEDWRAFVSKGRFSFAGAFMTEKEAFAIRNKNRPLWMSRSPSSMFIASTRDIFMRAGFKAPEEIREGQAVPLAKGSLCSSL